MALQRFPPLTSVPDVVLSDPEGVGVLVGTVTTGDVTGDCSVVGDASTEPGDALDDPVPHGAMVVVAHERVSTFRMRPASL